MDKTEAPEAIPVLPAQTASVGNNGAGTAAERRANSPHWSLICWFRPCGDGQRSFWAPYPLSSVSRAALFAQADQIPDAALAAFLAQHLE